MLVRAFSIDLLGEAERWLEMHKGVQGQCHGAMRWTSCDNTIQPHIGRIEDGDCLVAILWCCWLWNPCGGDLDHSSSYVIESHLAGLLWAVETWKTTLVTAGMQA